MKRELIGAEVNIDGKEGEITNVLGNGYEIVFFDINLGKTYIDNRDIVNYIVNIPDEWIKTDDYQYVRPSEYRKWQIVEARYTESGEYIVCRGTIDVANWKTKDNYYTADCIDRRIARQSGHRTKTVTRTLRGSAARERPLRNGRQSP